MIELKKPNDELIYLNPFVIESIEEKNFTVVILTNGKKVVIDEPVEKVNKKIQLWWRVTLKLDLLSKKIEIN